MKSLNNAIAGQAVLAGSTSDHDLERMLLIRQYELSILGLFSSGHVTGTTHTCMGQEYIPVALNPFIEEEDFVISNHRGHGHYIARYGDAEGLLAEVMGKQGAVCNGIGGSQHIRRDRFISTGVQAEGIAVGTGIAWSYKYKQQDNLVFVYIGDGTFGRGCVYESLNFAGIWNLPMVIVVENNGIAISTHQSYSMSGSIEGRVRGFGLDYLCIQSKAVNEIREQTGDAIHRVRKESKPLVIEFITDRVASHSKGDDTRSADELARVREKYWYNQMKASDKARVDKLEEAVRNQMQTLQELVIHREGAEWADYEKRKNK
ncbi:thiamine pyrophosphate-dependent dehydrogenase E1 component subunit alpha [Paenibacillus sp. FSL H3-0333]|uniref:thiamine pyrophosphate-dependent dehydrogenase E1 component subunit alpha n=1 Tax=Paenibacillus sp. FSL H3-0333 TaxID=2921373 RepID=UPI0030F6CD93